MSTVMTLIKHILFTFLLLTITKNQSHYATKASSSPSSTITPEIKLLLNQLSKSPNNPTSWRRLGKLQLDAGEFAEARRIFCHGSKCCPEDEGLKHHVKVFEAFHSPSSNYNDKDDESLQASLTPPPLSTSDITISNTKDNFLSLHIPPNAIPQSILQHPSSSIPNREQRTRLIHASKEPILPKQTCTYLIQQAIATTNNIGWTTNRHVQAPTCDVPVFDLQPAVVKWIRNAFEKTLFPMICKVVHPELDIAPEELRVQDCFIVRYDADASSPSSSEQNCDKEKNKPGFASLKPHQDESLLSLTIALNDMDQDYTDGGLYISSTQDVLNGPAGTVLCFAGGLVHGGFPVSSGTRWILTVFLYVDKNQSGRSCGYTLKALDDDYRNDDDGGD